MDPLRAVFEEFCAFGAGQKGGNMMDSRTCQKLCRDCGLTHKRRLNKTDIDLIFTKVKPKGERRITFSEFKQACQMFATKLGVRYQEVASMIANSAGPTLNRPTTAEYTKWHDDQTTYTGVHARGGPTTVDNRIVTLENLADRSPYNVRGVKLRHAQDAEAEAPLHPDWYQVRNPNATGAHDRYYYVNKNTNATQWKRPILAAPPPQQRHRSDKELARSAGRRRASSNSGQPMQAKQRSPERKVQSRGTGGGGNIFDRLTDHRLYTGTHVHRFDDQGRGKGLAGRDRIMKGFGYASTSGSYAAQSKFVGNTNTNTDETIHDISQVLMRR